LEDFIQGISIFQEHDITCAIVLEEGVCRVYTGAVISQKASDDLSEAGWKNIELFVWEYVGRPSRDRESVDLGEDAAPEPDNA